MIEESKERIVNLSGLNDYHGELMETIDNKLLVLLETCSQMVAQKYTKPSSGIPKTDLAQAVQTSLGKADSALQASDIVQLQSDVAALQSLVADGDNSTAAIDKFNEIVAFLANIENTETLEGIVAGISSSVSELAENVYTKSAVNGLLAQKQDLISDLSTIRQNAREGAEALEMVEAGTIGTGNFGFVDLGLPSGTLWAPANVGGGFPKMSGSYHYFASGDKDADDVPEGSVYDGMEIPLAKEADTAAQVLGGSWRMPTKAQLEELVANTTHVYHMDMLTNGTQRSFIQIIGNGQEMLIAIPSDVKYLNGKTCEGAPLIWSSERAGEDQAYVLTYKQTGQSPKLLSVETCHVNTAIPVRGVVATMETKLDGKVDKEDGKGLSANDYTDADKAKVDALDYVTSADIHSLFT